MIFFPCNPPRELDFGPFRVRFGPFRVRFRSGLRCWVVGRVGVGDSVREKTITRLRLVNFRGWGGGCPKPAEIRAFAADWS